MYAGQAWPTALVVLWRGARLRGTWRCCWLCRRLALADDGVCGVRGTSSAPSLFR
eukprot:COSAG01_NODE_6863_length_3465_cov_2.172608_3_plen_55_part_00